eukprot:365162-Chlamydomonas_euryale.AAC.22
MAAHMRACACTRVHKFVVARVNTVFWPLPTPSNPRLSSTCCADPRHNPGCRAAAGTGQAGRRGGAAAPRPRRPQLAVGRN